MTRCIEFYTRWRKDPNWCHKCKDAVRQINSYIDLVDGLEKHGIPSETTIVALPEWVARPLIAIQDEEIREKAIIKCQERLIGKIGAGRGNTKKLTVDDVEQIIGRAASNNVHFMSETDEWYTPREIIDSVLAVFGGYIDLDPCSNSKLKPNVPAELHYTMEDDGLSKSWMGKIYMNPPYGREIKDWVIKLIEEQEKGNIDEAIALVPARTDTEWFASLDPHPWCAIKGRLKFSENPNSAPFPSAIFYLGQDEDIDGLERFFRVFCKHGIVYQTVRG